MSTNREMDAKKASEVTTTTELGGSTYYMTVSPSSSETRKLL